ncbi:MAG: dihydrofolate reductase family protein [Nitrosopumilus sp.]|nr:dihydrofolate reductase family protein [Nitrosopumilus sp.]MDH3340097.1 dihydrofolate reductase family protein [Nitrosopumilus sp.]
MRKIILFIASSLDGCIVRENGDIDWLPKNTASGYDDFIKSVDTVIMGKTTYDQVLTFGDYPYKDKKSYIFTRNNDYSQDKNSQFVHDVDVLVDDILSNSGTNIWLVGGAEIISTFMNFNLVDEIILSVIPILLGNGISLFKNIVKKTKLELINTTDYEKLVELHYKVLR